jgi:Skp family chaperone for outer membrane proteins
MNRFAAIGFLGLGLMVSPLVGGMSADAEPNPIKIGVIDFEQTLYETPAGKRASEAFDKTRKTKQSELDKKQKSLQKAAADLDKQAPVLKPEVLAQKKGELEKNFVELQQTYVKLEKTLGEERNKLIEELLKKAGPIVEEIANQEGVYLILDRSAAIWAHGSVDLTGKLNARML